MSRGPVCRCHCWCQGNQFVTVTADINRTVTVCAGVIIILYHRHCVVSAEQLVTVSDGVKRTGCVAITVTAGVKRTVGRCIWWCQENSFFSSSLIGICQKVEELYDAVKTTGCRHHWLILFLVFNATFSNLSAISWQSPSLTDGVKRIVCHCICWIQDNNLSLWPLMWREKCHYDPLVQITAGYHYC